MIWSQLICFTNSNADSAPSLKHSLNYAADNKCNAGVNCNVMYCLSVPSYPFTRGRIINQT